MTHAYSELYLDDAMCIMGEMLDYAINDCGYEPDEYFNWFIASGIAAQFEKGNPKYVTGMSGIELALDVIYEITGEHNVIAASGNFSRAYWAGWAMAYYQWYRSITFSDMVNKGLPVSQVMQMYILHEADISKFADYADEIIQKNSC